MSDFGLPGAQSAGFAGPGSYPYWGSTPNPGAARSHRTKAGPAFAPRPPDGGRSARARRGKEVPQGTAQPDLVEGQAEPMGWSGSGLPLSATVLRATRSCSGPAARACAAGIEKTALIPGVRFRGGREFFPAESLSLQGKTSRQDYRSR